jgi:isopentenyl-diphosphate delta-isomerase
MGPRRRNLTSRASFGAQMTQDREEHLVELVDPDGAATGSLSVRAAHSGAGALHRAFSVMLVDAGGRVLLQQRSADKSRFAGFWSNTCCGHPSPGQSAVEAARSRLAQEIGVHGVALQDAGTFIYQADDPASGLVEWEFDHVLVARFEQTPTDLDPAEVSAVRWQPMKTLIDELNTNPAPGYTPWLSHVCRLTTALMDAEEA